MKRLIVWFIGFSLTLMSAYLGVRSATGDLPDAWDGFAFVISWPGICAGIVLMLLAALGKHDRSDR